MKIELHFNFDLGKVWRTYLCAGHPCLVAFWARIFGRGCVRLQARETLNFMYLVASTISLVWYPRTHQVINSLRVQGHSGRENGFSRRTGAHAM